MVAVCILLANALVMLVITTGCFASAFLSPDARHDLTRALVVLTVLYGILLASLWPVLERVLKERDPK